MKARFRVSYRAGGNATVGTLEEFYDLVQSGGIGPDDVIHDALTREWVPAKALPAYWLCTDPLVGVRDGAGAASDPMFALVAPVTSTPEQAAQAFVERMAEEREADPDRPLALQEIETLGDVELVAVSDTVPTFRPGSSTLEVPVPVALETTPQEASASVSSSGDTPTGAASAGDTRFIGSLAGIAVHDDRPHDDAHPYRHRREPRASRFSVALVVLMGSAGLAGGVGLAWPSFGEWTGPEDSDLPAAAVRPVTATEGELRSSAHRDFLMGVADVGKDLGIGPVPDIWLEGRYLADAAAFPAVATYWERYRDYVEVVRAREAVLYRAAYLGSLEAGGIDGPVRSLRLAAAVADFTRDRAARAMVYARVAALGDAALALHELSVGAAGRISYEPARANRVSADPVIEATGRDEEMQLALDAALDRVLKALHGDGHVAGPGRDGVATWLVEELGRI